MWSSLERLAAGYRLNTSLAAVPAKWRELTGAHYDAMLKAFLRTSGEAAFSYPCPQECGCAHEIIRHDSGRIVAVCRCDPWNCDDIPLEQAETMLVEVNWPKLGRAIASAFDCDDAGCTALCAGTRQVATFGGGVPVVLTIQQDRAGLTGVAAQLVATLKERFVLLAPTGRFYDAHSQALLKGSRAGFFDLDSNLTLTSSGQLIASKRAAELFAPYLMASVEPKAVNEMAVQPHPRYLLRRGVGVWNLVFDGTPGEIKIGRGISLVAYLLFNLPLGGLHGTDLAKLAFGQDILQEAGLGADGDSTRRLIQKEAKEWLAVMKDPGSSDIDKEEAMKHLEQLAKALNVTRGDSDGGSEKQVRAVRRAIERLIDQLRVATDRKNDPHPALRAFGEHLHKHLWIPSSRFARDSRSRARAGVAGQFTYERPAQVNWAE